MIVAPRLRTWQKQDDYIDNPTRKNILLFDGVSETDNEKLSEFEDKIRKIISEKLKLHTKHVVLEQVRCFGKPPGHGGKPRSIVLKFLRYKDLLGCAGQGKTSQWNKYVH